MSSFLLPHPLMIHLVSREDFKPLKFSSSCKTLKVELKLNAGYRSHALANLL